MSDSDGLLNSKELGGQAVLTIHAGYEGGADDDDDDVGKKHGNPRMGVFTGFMRRWSSGERTSKRACEQRGGGRYLLYAVRICQRGMSLLLLHCAMVISRECRVFLLDILCYM